MVKQDKKNINILIIQILALVLIALGFLIGMGPIMSRQMEGGTAELFRLAFKLYENLVRATIIILGVFFTLRYTLQKKGKVSRFRLTSLISFSTMAFIVLILIPVLTHFHSPPAELYVDYSDSQIPPWDDDCSDPDYPFEAYI